jgi:AcrR family transcriptional regulator
MRDSARLGDSAESAQQKGRKSTQRERLLAGMVTVANRAGYAGANVSAVIAQAGVSRPTFYDYFSDRDDCFLATLTDAHQALLARVRARIETVPPADGLVACVEELIGFAGAQPALARFLTGEPMAGGPRLLSARDRTIAEIAEVVERAHGRCADTALIPDVAPRMIIGGLYRLLASHLRRGEQNLASLLDELLPWIESYRRPRAQLRWSRLTHEPEPPMSPHVPETPLTAPAGLGPGRPRISAEQVAENQRLRILFAAAQLAEEKGYTASTIADITRTAGVDGRVFYSLFADKQDAFMTVHELGVRQVMAVTATAFFSGATWPERAWEAGRALTQFLQTNPLIAHVGFVEAPAVGPGAVQRVEDSHIAFAVFLQEGYQYAGVPAPPSKAALEAIVTATFELIYLEARNSPAPQLAGLLPHMTFLFLAPFLGAEQANSFVVAKLAAARESSV